MGRAGRGDACVATPNRRRNASAGVKPRRNLPDGWLDLLEEGRGGLALSARRRCRRREKA